MREVSRPAARQPVTGKEVIMNSHINHHRGGRHDERPRLDHHHASPRCRPARRGRADAGLRAPHRPSRCARRWSTGMTELHPAVADLDPRLRPLSKQDFDPPASTSSSTHLHFDHLRRHHLFAGRPIYVQRRGSTMRAARTTTPFASGSRRPACGTCRSTASSSCCPGSRRPARARRWSSSRPAGADRRRRRRGGLVRRARRPTPRPAAGARSTPSWSGSRTARTVATPHRLGITLALSGFPGFRAHHSVSSDKTPSSSRSETRSHRLAT